MARQRCRWFFFFQAEDGIRDYKVTGVQTCALPIFCRLKSFGWNVNRQTFSAKTPRGVMTFANLIATFRSPDRSESPSFLLCSHYDTKTFDTISFVGANDGGSSTGLLIEMARVLATQPTQAAKTELVFFDG